MTYTIEKVTTLIGAHRFGNADANIGFLLTDSRSLCFAEETLFFALKSGRGDGHNYISDLYRRGVRNFVVEHVPLDYATTYADANFLRVENSLVALQRLAERHRDEYNIPIVGITGSNGKTIVKEWLYQLLSPELNVTRSPRSYNSQIGVPLSVWLLNEQSQVGVFEAGISEPGEMLALRDIIQPEIAVLTFIGDALNQNHLVAQCLKYSAVDERCNVMEEELFGHLYHVGMIHNLRTDTYNLVHTTLHAEFRHLLIELLKWFASLVYVAQNECALASLMVRTAVHEVESNVERVDVRVVRVVDKCASVLSFLHFQTHCYRFQILHALCQKLARESEVQCNDSSCYRVAHRSLVNERQVVFAFFTIIYIMYS